MDKIKVPCFLLVDPI